MNNEAALYDAASTLVDALVAAGVIDLEGGPDDAVASPEGALAATRSLFEMLEEHVAGALMNAQSAV